MSESPTNTDMHIVELQEINGSKWSSYTHFLVEKTTVRCTVKKALVADSAA
jgi:hypothetical protein